jgi:hypothetical protein
MAMREFAQKPSLDFTAPFDSFPAGADRTWTPAGAPDGLKPMESSTPLSARISSGLGFADSAVGLPGGAWAGEDSPASTGATDSIFAMLADDGAEE